MPLKHALTGTMASAFWWWITVTPKSLENHRKNQEVGLLYDLFCVCSSVGGHCTGSTGLQVRFLPARGLYWSWLGLINLQLPYSKPMHLQLVFTLLNVLL
jgi:hypothetical protein